MVSQKGPNKSGAHLKKGVYSGKPRGSKKGSGGPAGKRDVTSKLVDCWKPKPKRRGMGAHLKKGVYTGKPRGRKAGTKNAVKA